MFLVVLMLYSIVAMTRAGTGAIVVLVAGVLHLLPIVSAAAAGAITALPIPFFVTRNVVA